MKRIILLFVLSFAFLAPKPVKKKYVPKNPEHLIGEWEVFQVRELTCDCDDDFTPEKAFGFIVKFPGTLLGRKLNIGNETSVFHLEKVQDVNKMFTDFTCGFYSKEPEKTKIGQDPYPTIGKFIDRLNKGSFPKTEAISNEAIYGRKFREIVQKNRTFEIYDIHESSKQSEKTCDSPHKTIALFKKTVMVTVVGNTILFLQRLHPDQVGVHKKALDDPFKKKKKEEISQPENEDDDDSENEEPPVKKTSVIQSKKETKKEIPKKNVPKKEEFQLDDDEEEDEVSVKKEASKKVEKQPAKKEIPKKKASAKKEEFQLDDDEDDEPAEVTPKKEIPKKSEKTVPKKEEKLAPKKEVKESPKKETKVEPPKKEAPKKDTKKKEEFDLDDDEDDDDEDD